MLATNGQSLHTKRIDMRGVFETFFMETKMDKESELFMNFSSSQIQIWLLEYFLVGIWRPHITLPQIILQKNTEKPYILTVHPSIQNHG